MPVPPAPETVIPELARSDRDESSVRRGSPLVIDGVPGPRSRHRRHGLDRASRAWVEALYATGARREDAVRQLHALMLREARFEVRIRAAALPHPSGRDLDDLAMQAANDSVVAILAKLDQFRGDSLFTTWARRFAEREAPAKLRRRVGHLGELPMELGLDPTPLWPARGATPHERCVANDVARTLVRLIAQELTDHQREVLIELTVNDVGAEDFAGRLGTTSGALYKTLHDARRKLRTKLGEAEDARPVHGSTLGRHGDPIPRFRPSEGGGP